MSEKRKDAQIYIFMHKEVPYGIWDNSLYTPLQVGSEGKKPLVDTRDNTGENISEWNPLYAEMTGAYWIWKNHPKDLKYIGETQYRRRIEFPEDTDFDDIFSKYDVITMHPLKYKDKTVREAYELSHCKQDLELLEEILKEKYPEYVDNFNEIMNDKFLFYSNGFMMKAEDYDRYCEWLFSILQDFRDKRGWNTPQRAIYTINLEILTGNRKRFDNKGIKEGNAAWHYQRQVLAFLSERLLTIWLRHNFEHKHFLFKKYKLLEDIKY